MPENLGDDVQFWFENCPSLLFDADIISCSFVNGVIFYCSGTVTVCAANPVAALIDIG